MLQYMADSLPYRPHSLEQAQYGLGSLVVLIVAVVVLSKAMGGNRQSGESAAPARGRAGKGFGVVLVIIALVLIGKSYDKQGSSNPAPSHPVTTPSHKSKPDPGSTHCTFICVRPKN